jgi:hypothetical protein
MDEPHRQTQFWSGCLVGIIWVCFTSQSDVTIRDSNPIDKHLISNTDTNFVKYLHLSKKQLMVSL